MKKLLLGAASSLVVLLAPTLAHAIACTNSIVTDNTTFNPSYVSCTGSFEGNTSEGQISYGLDTFNFIGKTGNDNTGAGPFQAFGAGFNNGQLIFDQAWTGTFVLALKAGNDFSLYKFSSAGPVTSIFFDTLGVSVNKNGIGNGLSHAALYGGVAAAVPEPETYALMLAGLSVIGFVARRRRPRD